FVYCFCSLKWKHRGYGGTHRARLNFELPAQFAHPLVHSPKPYSLDGLALFDLLYCLRRDADSAVGDPDISSVLVFGERYPDRIASGMPLYVRQRFLRYTEKRQFHLLRESAEVVRRIQIHLNPAALRKSGGIPTQSRKKSQFIEQRRMQQIGNRAHLLHASLECF